MTTWRLLPLEEPMRQADLPVGFRRFWQAWPSHYRKVDRIGCLRFWMKARLEDIADGIVAAVERQKTERQWTKQGGEFIPQPLTWLHQQRWEAPPQEEPAKKEW